MSFPPKEKLEMELSAWHASELLASVPIKKRRFLFQRSPSPPQTSSKACTLDNCAVQMMETTFPTLGTSVSLTSNIQIPDIDHADSRKPFIEQELKSFTGRQLNSPQNGEASNSPSEQLLFTLGAAYTPGVGNEGNFISENKPAVKPIAGTVSEIIDFRSTLGDGNTGNKLVLSEKSAFQRVLSNTELPLPLGGQPESSVGEPSALGTSANDGLSGSCKLELSLSENQPSCSNKQRDAELGSSQDDRHSSRSHWDLNTTMDTWGSCVSETTLDILESGNSELNLGSIYTNKSEMEPSNESQQESAGMHAISEKSMLAENACSQLTSILKPDPDVNATLNLQINTAFGSKVPVNLVMPFPQCSPGSDKTLDSHLSVKLTTVTESLKSVTHDAIKAEPMEEIVSGKDVGISNFMSVNHGIVKSEASDAIRQENVRTICPKGLRTTCQGAIKLEQLHLPDGLRPREEGGVDYCECSSNAIERFNLEGIHHFKDVKVCSSGFVQDSTGDIKKNFLETPNVNKSPSPDMDGGLKNSVDGTKPLVSSDAMLGFGQDMPSNVDQLHTTLVIDSTQNVIPEPVSSDVNDSHIAGAESAHDRQQDIEESDTKSFENFSESALAVCNVSNHDGGVEKLVDIKSSFLADVELEELGEVECFSGFVEHNSYSGIDTEVPADILEDLQAVRTCLPGEKDAERDMREPDYSYEKTVGPKARMSKQHNDDDDYEDGEFRESLSRIAIKGSCNAKEQKNLSIEEGVVSDVPPITLTTVLESEGTMQNLDTPKDVRCMMESESHVCPENADAAGFSMPYGVKESSAIENPIVESNEKKAVKIDGKMPVMSCKEDLEPRSVHKKFLASSIAKGYEAGSSELGSQQEKLGPESGYKKVDALRSYDFSKHAKDRSERSDHDRIARFNSSTDAPSSGRLRSSHKSSSRSERERSKEKSDRRDKVHMKSSRDENQVHRLHNSGKERDSDHAFRQGGSVREHLRGRMVQHLDSLRDDWEPDHGYASEHFYMSNSSRHPRPNNASEVAFDVDMDGILESSGRAGKKHMDDELCRAPPRRPSSGGNGPMSVGVQVVRRTMREISPGRCIEEDIPEVMLHREGKLMRGFADDMVHSSLGLRNRLSYEPARNRLIRRERSLSPFQRRTAAHASNAFASSTRPRPHMWSPTRRPPEVFDGHPDLIHCRSPDIRVDRMRSPGQRDCFEDNILGRRHISPRVAHLHREITDANLLRGHDLPKPGRHPQGNLRRFDLIDHRANPDNFGPVQPGQFRELEADEVFAEERRNSDDAHGLARPFRQHYIIDNDANNDGSFHHRLEDIPPRPVRLCQDEDEEFPSRGISRVGSIRNRLGNMHNRRLMGITEQEEDDYRHDNGWRGENFKGARLKRRRF